MEMVGQVYRSLTPTSPPSAITKQPPIMGEIIKGWVLNSRGQIVWAGARNCEECGGTSGEKENECSSECSLRCIVCAWAKLDTSTPNWIKVGLWPDRTYDQLGMKLFFESAQTQKKLPKKQRGEEALEVAWGYVVGSKIFASPAIPVLATKFNGVGFDKFKADFASCYGPGMEYYVGPECVVTVTRQSVEYLQQFQEEHGNNRETDGYRASIGTKPEALFKELMGISLASIKAKTLVSSEYWPIFKDQLLPTKLSKAIEELVGGKKKAAAIYTEAATTRLEAASIYDRETRKLEFDNVFETKEKYENDLNTIKTQRSETKGQLPDYPPDDQIHAFKLMFEILSQETKICKKSGNVWKSACYKAIVVPREKTEEALLKLIDKTEKVAVKTSKVLMKTRKRAAEKWIKQGRKVLDARCKPFVKGCSTIEYATDISRDNPKYAWWAVDLKVAEKCIKVTREQEDVWKTSIPKIANADLSARRELMRFELSLLAKVKAARAPNFAKNCKDFEKLQRSNGQKKYKFDIKQAEAADFLKQQDEMKEAHRRWFSKMEILLEERHDTTITLISKYYSELQEIVYPLHTFDHNATDEWSTDHATSSMVKSLIGNKSARRSTLNYINETPLDATPTALIYLESSHEDGGGSLNIKSRLGGNTSPEKHPALLIMMAKVANGQISQEEYDMMVRIHNDSFTAADDEEVTNHDNTVDMSMSQGTTLDATLDATLDTTDIDDSLPASPNSDDSDFESGPKTPCEYSLASPIPHVSEDGGFKSTYQPMEYKNSNGSHKSSLGRRTRSNTVLILDESDDEEVFDAPTSSKSGNPFTDPGKPGNPFTKNQNNNEEEA